MEYWLGGRNWKEGSHKTANINTWVLRRRAAMSLKDENDVIWESTHSTEVHWNVIPEKTDKGKDSKGFLCSYMRENIVVFLIRLDDRKCIELLQNGTGCCSGISWLLDQIIWLEWLSQGDKIYLIILFSLLTSNLFLDTTWFILSALFMLHRCCAFALLVDRRFWVILEPSGPQRSSLYHTRNPQNLALSLCHNHLERCSTRH